MHRPRIAHTFTCTYHSPALKIDHDSSWIKQRGDVEQYNAHSIWDAPELLGGARRHSVSLTRFGISEATTSAMGTRLCAAKITGSIVLQRACDHIECIQERSSSLSLAHCLPLTLGRTGGSTSEAKNAAIMGQLNVRFAIGGMCV